jgi:electron transport complex protein RnfG
MSQELPVRPHVPSWKLIATLAVAGVAAGLLIVSVHLWTQPRILEHQARALREAVREVLGAPETTTTLYLIEGALTEELPPGVDSLSVERVFLGFDESGQRMGVAISGGEPGFQDVINLIFGYDHASARVLGMKVLDNKETPGLGDKIVKDSSFVAEFVGARAPLAGIKPGSGSGAESEIDMITGATISSRAVIAIINHRVEAVAPLLDQYFRSAAVEPGASSTVAGAGGGP